MGDPVTMTANRLIGDNGLIMGLVTLDTLDDGPMFLRVTLGAGKGGMLGFAGGQPFIGQWVAELADLARRVVGIDDLKGLMRRMTGKAVLHAHCLGMSHVALKAGGFIPVMGVVTSGAIKLGVKGFEGLHLTIQHGMTSIAGQSQLFTGGNLKRRMGLTVAPQTLHQLLAVRFVMALGTLRNHILIFGFTGTIVVKLFVTTSALNPVLGPGGFKQVEDSDMTFPALPGR